MVSYDDERAFAVDLARSAGEIALRYFRTDVAVDHKAGGEPVTEADREINAHIVEALNRRFPDDAVLAEESPPDPRRFEVPRTWMVDPIDGTREFINGTDNWEVFIGLVHDRSPVVGVVFNAVNQSLVEASRGWGTMVERAGTRRRVSRKASDKKGPEVLGVREGRYGEVAQEMAKAIGIRKVVTRSGFGARALLALESEVDMVLQVGGQPREWDTCAVDVALEEAGLIMTDCNGKRLAYIKEDPIQRDGIVVTPQPFLEMVLGTVVPIYRASRDRR